MTKNILEQQLDFIKTVKFQNLKLDQKITLGSAATLIIGTFIPVMSQAVSSVTLYNLNLGYALSLVISALASGYLMLYPKVKYTIISNIVASLVYLLALINTWSEVNQYQEYLKSAYGKNSLVSAYINLDALSWNINWFGWLVMLIGIAGIFYSVRKDLKGFYLDMKNKITKVAKNNRQTTVVEVEPKTQENGENKETK
jgi:hypothetical protein